MELSTVTDRTAVFHGPGGVVPIADLEPSTAYEHHGTEFRTLPDLGEEYWRFATANDVHFGETICGHIAGDEIGPRFSVDPGADPYPEFMNAGAVAEIGAIDPELVVVKGDLTSGGLPEEYERFLEVYGGSFGARLLHVRGNHDSYAGGEFAAWPMQSRELPGLTIALLDTARTGRVNGRLSAEQLEWLDELGASARQPVMVFGHHHVWNPAIDPRSDRFFGIVPDDSERLFAVFARRPWLVAYFAGHTHRNRRQPIGSAGGRHFVEVGCVKDYPGTWAEYRVCEQGVMQVHHRISTPEALSWSERTKAMFNGSYGQYALGALGDRCFVIPWRRGAAGT